MTEGTQNLAQQVQDQTQDLTQQIQEQTLKSAQDFYGNSLGSLKSQLENDRSQLQDLLDQIPESQGNAREQLEQLVASYEAIEDSLEEAAQQQGVEDKAARMVAMCQKAEVAEPLDVAALAVAAFEDLPLKRAIAFIRADEQNIKDLAWAFQNSNSPEEFEQKIKEIKQLPAREEKP